MSSLKVALNSRFWRFGGSAASTFLMSWMKPMSSMRSASSSTRISMPKNRSPSGRRCRAGGPASRRMSTPLAGSASICGLMPTPPKMQAEVSGRTCRRRARFLRPGRPAHASGARISARAGACREATGWVLLEFMRRCSIGSTKPAVLPVPVWAPPSRSPPAARPGWPDADRGRRAVAMGQHGAHEFVTQSQRRETVIGRGRLRLGRRRRLRPASAAATCGATDVRHRRRSTGPQAARGAA